MPYWQDQFSTGYMKDGHPDVTASQSSEIVSLLSAGTFFGALTAGPTGEFFGRRYGLMVSVIVFTLGVILQTAATAIPMFVAGRFFAGYGVGMLSALIPLYQSETAPKWIRGTIVGAYQLAITIGLLIAAIVDHSTANRQDTGSYRIPIAVQFAWGLILFFGMLLLPETPRMYLKRGKPERAAKSLSTLRRLDIDHPALVEELGEIQANHEYEMALGSGTYLGLLQGQLGQATSHWLSPPGSSATHGCQLHLLLRNVVLQELRIQRFVYCQYDHIGKSRFLFNSKPPLALL